MFSIILSKLASAFVVKMSFYDFYDKFFRGSTRDNNRFADLPPQEKDDDNSARDSLWDFGGNDTRDPFFNFNITGDPFQMHNFFEKKMNDIIEAFFTPDLFPGFGDFQNKPAIEESINPRDLYLKPEFSQTNPGNRSKPEDVEKEEDWLGRMLPSPSQPEAQVRPRVFSSFRSVIRKTVTLPDGTVKTEEIIRNSDGTEQRSESQTLPNGSHPPQFNFPLIDPGFSGFFNHLDRPQKNITSEFDFLKPGFENISPHEEKIDKDLDKEIVSSGIRNLPTPFKSPDIPESKPGFGAKTFTRRTVTLPNGVVESEEIVRNPDGTEQRTVTQTLSDQTPLKSNDLNNDRGGNTGLSVALKGVKDLIDIFFK